MMISHSRLYKRIEKDLKRNGVDFRRLSYHRLKDQAFAALESGDSKLSHKIDIAADMKEVLLEDNPDEDKFEILAELYLSA